MLTALIRGNTERKPNPVWNTILNWLDDWQLRREQVDELARLRAENVQLHADLVAADSAIGQLRQSYQFYYDAYCANIQERAHAR